ncbi:MAG TPA: ATP-grasp domain-containing protein [Ignavibacteriaceae bacterium]|nr:ATP-grasp domain-containing protein [Ignavibacteriaceae bacterium]
MKIAVTGLNATDNPGPGVPVIRSLREADKDISIIGLLYDALEPGIYLEDVADKSYLIPYPSSGLQSLFERLEYIHKKENIDIIIPTLDSELYAFSKLADKLSSIGIKTYLPTLEQLNIRAKDKLFDFCKENGIKVPKNILAASIQDLDLIKKEFEYPVVIKGIFYEAYIANNKEEALTYFSKLSAKWGFPIIIQEYIKGTEFNVTALGDGTGDTVGAVPMRKLYITDKGKGWSGITINDNNLLEISKKIISISKWKSGLELEYMKYKDEYYLLEINPRFPAWVYLATAAGMNMPYSLIELAQGKRVEPMQNYEVGKMFIRCSWDLISDIKKFEEISVNGEFTL